MSTPTRKSQATSFLLLAIFSTVMLLSPMVASAQTTHNTPVNRATSSILVQGTTATNGTFSGVLKLTQFAVQNGVLTATGLLNGTLTDPTLAGGAPQAVTNQLVTVPIASVSGSCQILSLTLGPLSLNLLGLQVNLNQVVLNITAQAGPGNLLGNLLCSVANLLNGGLDLNALLGQLAGLLNQILGAL